MLDILRGFPRSPEPGTPGDPGVFEPGSVAWRVNGERAMLVGGGRALLLQLAHPAVAAAVAAHSDFPAEPYTRLWRTLEAMLAVSFGDTAQSRAAAERVNAVHRTVSGPSYDATDPDLLLWVHATLVDSALVVYERFVGPLSVRDRASYFSDMRRQGQLFGIPEQAMPKDLAAFHRYVEQTIDRLEVTDDARRIASEIVSPPVPLALVPAARAFGLVTVGLLPDRVREGYGYRWGPLREAGLGATRLSVRAIVPMLPRVLRRWPHARAAEARARSH